MAAHNRGVVGLIIGLAVIAGASIATAQEEPEKKMLEKTTGSIMAMRPGYIQVAVDGTPWVIKIEPTTTVNVVGTAEVDFLRPQLIVRFKGEFNAKGRAMGEVQELEIVSPSLEVQPGVFPESAGFDALETKPAPGAAATYTVVGRLTSFKKGKMIVQAGNQPVKADLADGAPIKVDVSDYSIAAPNDPIVFAGWSVQEGQAVAEAILITLTNPLTSGKKRVVRAKPSAGETLSPLKPLEEKPAAGGLEAGFGKIGEKPAEKPALEAPAE